MNNNGKPVGSSGKRANLKELSAHLSLSQTTVSRALNGYKDVSEKTRERVIAAAEELGYRPNFSARRLATGKAKVIGIAFPSDHSLLVDPNFWEFLAGLSEKASQSDCDIMISATEGSVEDAYKRFAMRGSVDLVVLSNVYLSEDRIGQLKQLGMPFVVHGTAPSRYNYAYLDIDNFNVFYEPAKLLLQFGHKRIAIINGERGRSFAVDRERGWRQALEEAELTAPEEYIHRGEMSEDVGYEAAKRLLALPNPPTAILCSHVFSAKGAYRACRRAGLQVGKDISIIAHDDVLPVNRAEELEPALTVTRSPLRAAGHEIAEIAMKALDGVPIEELQIVWQPEFVLRGSVGAAPGSS
ncbi:LacI family DNA-binding transcriptional regulator [Polycladidibacter hongkongensis]|uniref:LacI family DNA-binding transcriptional regulator n=1 Tax=Polycladidibacter hongkongensis TaxID=1647556 RepID=UPI00083363D9|nr:substrate-binding domain-containing protein [Pseudovibrio hongkongensis]